MRSRKMDAPVYKIEQHRIINQVVTARTDDARESRALADAVSSIESSFRLRLRSWRSCTFTCCFNLPISLSSYNSHDERIRNSQLLQIAQRSVSLLATLHCPDVQPVANPAFPCFHQARWREESRYQSCRSRQGQLLCCSQGK